MMEVIYFQANGEDSDSDYDDEAEETALESYNTPLDADECTIDEYQVFINAMKGMLYALPRTHWSKDIYM